MSTSVSSIPASDLYLASRLPPVRGGPDPAAAVRSTQRPIIISQVSGSSGADPMALFDSLLVSVDITGPQMLRSSRYAAQLYREMQRLLLRLN